MRLRIPREYRFPAITGLALVIVVGVLVASSLGRPAVETFLPTAPSPSEAGDTLAGPITYTIDASSTAEWRYFDFSRGSVVGEPGPTEWDLAFQRFYIIANGGDGFPGMGGILALEGAQLDSVAIAPADGYQGTRVRRDSVNLAIRRWYDYGFTSHLLVPKANVYVVRTSDGRYAKLTILSYYCPGAQPGCLTFRYVYQGSGARDLRAQVGGEEG